jgi:histidinol-phosphate/aromatic aminotransferase/cobyric acid decarboxylase-like protein
LQQHTARGGFGPYRFGSTDNDRTRHRALYALIAMVPARARIVASERLVPHVSSRPDAYTMRVGLFDADYMLFSVPAWGDERPAIIEGLRGGAFGVVAEQADFVLARRGAPTERNAAVLKNVGS